MFILFYALVSQIFQAGFDTLFYPGMQQGGRQGGQPPILADQLTLSQPGGTYYPHPVLRALPDFQTLRRPWSQIIKSKSIQFWTKKEQWENSIWKFGLIFTKYWGKLAFKIDYDNILNKKQVLKSE